MATLATPANLDGMNLVRTIVNGVIVATVVRELSKPENQRKLKNLVGKVANAARR